MTVTIFGLLVVAVGMLLLAYGSVLAMFGFVLVASLLGGSAGIILTGLGNSSIPPGNLALVFLVLRCLMAGMARDQRLGEAIMANRALALFALYGALGAWLLPRVFAGMINVTPLRPDMIYYLYATSPLRFSSQNITVSVYLIGTLLAAICGYLAGTRPGAPVLIARLGAVIAGVHALLGLASIPLGRSAFFAFFRNGFYAQLDQSIAGVGRMNGIWAEPATYAAFGVIWFAFTAELWLRNIENRWTGPAFAAIMIALVLSTSTTAYVGIIGYAAVLLLRQAAAPRTLSVSHALWLLGALLLGAVLLLLIVIALPDIAAHLDRVVTVTLGEKLDSASGLQRAFWARQGIDAFVASGGLGIGAGSFRSSSLLTAIVGSTGIIGTAAFLLYVIQVLAPLRRSTYRTELEPSLQVGVASSWTAVIMLLPAFLSAPSPDPGHVWGLLCGFALALRCEPAPLARPAGTADRPVMHAAGALP